MMSVEITIGMSGPREPEVVRKLMEDAVAELARAGQTPERLIANAKTIVRLGPMGSVLGDVTRFPFGRFRIEPTSSMKDGLVVLA